MGELDPKKKKPRRKYQSYVFYDDKGKLYAKVQVRQPTGKYKTIKKRAVNLTHVKQIAAEIQAEYADRGTAYLDGSKMTFGDLAEWYKAEFVIAPVYVDGARAEGMATWKGEEKKIDRIVAELGTKLLNDIDDDVLRHFRRKRLKTVGIATANRDMETIRAMMRKAVKKKWKKDAIDFEGLIDKSLEPRRTVTVTDAEIERVLAESRGMMKSPRLYALILTLYDGGARPSEIYPVGDYRADYSIPGEGKYVPLRWRDVMRDGEIVDVTIITSTKGKRIKKRFMAVSNRMADAYRDLWRFLLSSKNVTPEHAADLDNLIFPHRTYQSAWEVVRKAANLDCVRLRDLRRDWVTRMAKDGLSDRLAQRGAGHEQMQQTFEYTEFDMAAALQVKELLDRRSTPRTVIESDAVN
jgi:integrase